MTITPTYRLEVLTPLGQFYSIGSMRYALNRHGDVVGIGHFPSTAFCSFLYQHGQLTYVPCIDTWPTHYSDINNDGLIAGTYTQHPRQRSRTEIPFVRRGEHLQPLTVPGRKRFSARVVNNHGSVLLTSPEGVAYVSQVDRTEPLRITAPVTAFDMNDAGQVVGRTKVATETYGALLWSQGETQVLPLPDGVPIMQPRWWGSAINNLGQIVGMCDRTPPPQEETTRPTLDTVTVVLRWSPQHDAEVVETLHGRSVMVFALNDAGYTVGASIRSDYQGLYVAHLWIDRQRYDLETCLETDTAWHLLSATDINNAGQIAVLGKQDDTYYAGLLHPTNDLARGVKSLTQ